MLADTSGRKEKGERLQRAREAARPKISQREMAERVGVSESSIQKYEAGAAWNQGTVDLILDVLGLPHDYLDGDRESLAVSQESADTYWWRQLDEDVQGAVLLVSVWLSRYRGELRRQEFARLSAYMIDRDRVNAP